MSNSSYYTLNMKYNILLELLQNLNPPIGGYIAVNEPSNLNQTINGNWNLTSNNINLTNTNLSINPTSQFNNDVNIGSLTTSNLSPAVNTYKSTVNIGNNGQGNLYVNCPMTFGGFGTFTMQSSTISLTSGAKITQATTSNVNQLSTTQFTNTTVGSLTSLATQPATSDNSTKIPTTAWVQSLFNTIPASVSPMPYLWCNSQLLNTAGGSFGAITLNFTGSSWNNNEYFTIKYVLSCEWGGTTGNSIYNYSYLGITNIYPNRVPGFGSANGALLNGSINGSVPSFGSQWYYNQQYSGQYNYNPNNYLTTPVYITATNQTQFIYHFPNPVQLNAGNATFSFSLEILQKGQSGQSITSSGLFGNYYNTF